MAAKKPPRDKGAPESTELELVGVREQVSELRYMPPVMCQVGLPRKTITDREFMRQSGDAWLFVQAGKLDLGKGPVDQPVPSGAMPRLALAYINTMAVRNKTQEIPLGDSAADFLRLIGLDGGGERYKTLSKQMHALAACRMQMGFRGSTINSTMVDQFEVWQKPDKDHQRPLWQGKALLSDSYYKSLLERVVPLDSRALLALSGSALGLDVYCMLAHRLHRLDRPLDLSWHQLHAQFGQEYKDWRSFRNEFLIAVERVRPTYPSARIEKIYGGLRFFPSSPAVPYKPA